MILSALLCARWWSLSCWVKSRGRATPRTGFAPMVSFVPQRSALSETHRLLPGSEDEHWHRITGVAVDNIVLKACMQQHSLASLQPPPPISASSASSAPSMQTMSFASTGQLLSHNLFEGTAPPIVPAALDAFGGAPSSSNGTTAPAPNLWPWAPQPSLVPFDGQTASSLIPSLRVAAFSSSSSARGRKRKQIDTVPPARESAGNFELMLSPSEFSSKTAATRAFGGHGTSKSLVPVPGTNLNWTCAPPGLTSMRPRDAKVKPAVKAAAKTSKTTKTSPRNSAAGAKLTAPHCADAESLKAVVVIDESGTPRLVQSCPRTEVPALCTLAEVASVLNKM